jgi:ribosomal protein S18 acetylase RimI-like enzyme
MLRVKNHQKRSIRMIETRPAEKRDIPAISELQREIFSYSYSEKKFEESLSQIFLVAELDKQIIGFVICERTGVGISMGVSKQHREQGAGRRLMIQVEKELTSLHVKKVRIHIRENNPFLGFFKKIGYIEKAVVPSYYKDGSGALFMEKDLQ